MPEVLRGRTLAEAGATRPFGLPTAYDVLCFPIIEWGHRFQRPQQLATKFAEHGQRVYYLELTFHDQGPEVLWREVAPRIFQIQLPGPVGHNRFLESLPEEAQRTALAALERFCEQAGLLDAVCLVELPLWTSLALGLRERYGWKVVYDCMDEHSGLTILRPEMLADETRLSREADLVLVSSGKLREKHASLATRLLLLPNAADFEHFNRAVRGRELRRLPRPIIGYYGAISSGWFDTGLVVSLAEARPELAIHTPEGGVWHNDGGLGWTNPYDRRVWEYNVDVAAAAAKAGFDEIMFDYLRFPSDGDVSQAAYTGRRSEPKWQTVADFARYATERLHPLGVRVSAAVFGLAATRDLGIGQRPRLLATYLDAIYPMVYPSHFGPGEYQIDDPDAQPGRTVSFALLAFRQKLEGRRAELVPWLQDFSLGRTYTPADVAQQVEAARRASTAGFMLWNALGVYTAGALAP